jgi:hypothetical protein
MQALRQFDNVQREGQTGLDAGQHQGAAHLLGASESFLECLRAFIIPADKQEFDRIRTELGL